MTIICSFILIKRSFNFRFFNDVLILNYGDILLVNPSLMTSFLTFSDKFTEVPLNEDTVNHYIHHRHTGGKKQHTTGLFIL